MIVPLRTEADLDRMLTGSQPVLIFKHSTRCPISAAAYRAFRRFAASRPGAARYGVVHVIEQRALSDAIARRLGVQHASPQVLLWHRGMVRWHASHDAIHEAALAAALAGITAAERRGRARPRP
ncbi:bacillithiol system redox-active protein YtxJ [Thermaerobacter composti]|uniref:Bacillithiol system redox-active protein YtxJ n=1 Tax=Thermaerobacter composti TaxID=554949 RepID=A0ABZ0QQI3_9FIRM|nr:bacillithiol system redox-active protein YtxJ [Thermaerobacter composti]WPD19751.1 bacillithiol system redox-active protein YtxJ [Thermaerobacter composti]